MSVNATERAAGLEKKPIQQFKVLSRYYGEPLYPGEHQFISELIQQFDRLNFPDLVRLVDSNQEKLILPWELRRVWRLKKLSPEGKDEHYANYARQRMEAGRGDVRELRLVLDHIGFKDYAKPLRLLDLGTGRGSFLAMAQAETLFSAWHFKGVDMDMASLLLNLKFNEELGNRNFDLTCCYGETLPYDAKSFDIVASFQTLEHVGNLSQQVAFIREACRCLAPDGIAMFTFPNRFDVLRPEPHVYIRGFGFVPQKWKNRISHALRGVPSGDVYPPNPITLIRGLRKTEGVEFEVRSAHELSNKGLKRLIARSLLYRMFGPWNVLIARKSV